MIHVEKNRLRAFEQNALPIAARLIQRAPCRAAIRQNARRDFFQCRENRYGIDFFHTCSAPNCVVMREQTLEFCG